MVRILFGIYSDHCFSGTWNFRQFYFTSIGFLYNNAPSCKKSRFSDYFYLSFGCCYRITQYCESNKVTLRKTKGFVISNFFWINYFLNSTHMDQFNQCYKQLYSSLAYIGWHLIRSILSFLNSETKTKLTFDQIKFIFNFSPII